MNALFARNIGEIPRTIRSGVFDFYLIKPVVVQFYAAFRRFGVYDLGNISAGIALLIYALATSPELPSLAAIPLFIVAVFVGLVIFYSLLIMVVSLAFVLERLEGIWAFMNIFSEPLTVPFDIFPTTARFALTYLLPLAFVVFVPAQALTGRLTWQQVPLGIGIAAILFFLANLAWRGGLRRYTSASS
jgi:ABC-2 type transport system permease protein